MMTDKPEGGEYGTGFKRCAEGWRLYHEANAAPSYPDYVMAWSAYRQHVIHCQECKAVKGRFMEEVEG